MAPSWSERARPLWETTRCHSGMVHMILHTEYLQTFYTFYTEFNRISLAVMNYIENINKINGNDEITI